MNIKISDQIIAPLVIEYNEAFGGATRILASKDAVLSGQGGTLDSMELINFIVMAESKIREVTGKNIGLMTEEALTLNPSPFLTLGNLENYISAKLGATGGS
jgi:hypothetical protein